MDAGPLIKLALADQLDLLLCFDLKVYIPDEVYFEAAEKYAWEHQLPPTADKLQAAYEAIGLTGITLKEGPANITATLQTPKGLVTLHSHGV